jgi:hypothetical protein
VNSIWEKGMEKVFFNGKVVKDTLENIRMMKNQVMDNCMMIRTSYSIKGIGRMINHLEKEVIIKKESK